jgi:hypothetical protein
LVFETSAGCTVKVKGTEQLRVAARSGNDTAVIEDTGSEDILIGRKDGSPYLMRAAKFDKYVVESIHGGGDKGNLYARNSWAPGPCSNALS